MDLTNYREITELLARHGFRFSKSMGQNFLTEAWVPQRIAEESLVTEDEGVLEVGPGIGCLTERLSERAGKVVALELDESLRSILAETLAERDNVTVLFRDALKTDLKALCTEQFPGKRVRVCANLPYNVTTPLLTAFLEAGCFETITVMIQKEVAERICARPGTGEYGAFTVLCDWYAEREKLFDVPNTCFVPRPKVTSSVIRLTRRETPRCIVRDEKLFFRVVRAAFNQRRKTLPNALSAGLSELTREEAEECIVSAGLAPQIRGEALSTADFATVTETIFCKMHK